MSNNNIINIIDYIKKNSNLSLNDLEINIKKNYVLKDISQKLLLFLINLVLQNLSLLSDTLLEIFINSQKKVTCKIAVKKDDTQITLDTINTYNTLLLDIFSNFGSIYIIPKQVILLWNESAYSQKFNINTSIFNSNVNNEKTSIIIKHVNYNIINISKAEYINEDKIFNNYTRKIGLKQYKFGFQTNFQLALNLDIETLFITVQDIYYGKVLVFLNNNKYELNLTNKNNLSDLLNYYKKDLINIFKKNLNYALRYLHLFIEDEIFSNHINIIFEILKISVKLKEKKKYFKTIKYYDLPVNNYVFISETCEHENILNDFYKNANASVNYFDKLNEFVQTYVLYNNGIAICKICHEYIPSLFIKENLYFDKTKYIVNINNDILNYDPYNKFLNAKNYFENIFYLFNYYTKLNFNIDNNFIIRLCLDFFIKINSLRIELENKYKKDISENNIFFLRLSVNFFESDIEKEKYQDKKIVFTYFPIFIIIFISLSAHDYDDLIFVQKQLNVFKYKKSVHNLSFEDILISCIIFLFKKFSIDYYDDLDQRNKYMKIKRTIEIYYEIFQEEIQHIYLNKKKIIELFLKNKSQTKQYIEIINYDKSIKDNDIRLDVYGIRKDNDTKYIIYEEHIKSSFLPKKQINFNKNSVIHVDLNIFDKKTFKFNKTLTYLNNNYEKINTYIYINEIYNIEKFNNNYILYNDNNSIIKQETDLMDLKLNTTDKLLTFFVINDNYIYKNNIQYFEFINILLYFIVFLKEYYNVQIINNIKVFFDLLISKKNEEIYNRSSIFYYKIEIVNYIQNILKNNKIKLF